MKNQTFSIRLANNADIGEMVAFDRIASESEERVNFIGQSVAKQECYVADDQQVLGYAVFSYSFFGLGFVDLLYIHPDWRQQGVGTALMQHLESLCTTAKLFTSTNLSNHPMQLLLAKLGYKLSGIIHDFDEDDPEFFYVKYLPR